MLACEADNLIKCAAPKLERAEPINGKFHTQCVCGLIRSRMSIAIARAAHLCISRVSALRVSRKPLWEDEAGVGLHETDD